MAIIFEMQVEFDGDFSAQKRFCEYMGDIIKPAEINGKHIAFHLPKMTFVTIPANAWTNTSIVPMNVGFGVSFDPDDKHIELNDEEMFQLSLHMYDFLRGAPGYSLAMTGWELGMVDSFAPTAEDDVSQLPDGLVLHSQKYSKWISAPMVLFDDYHHWIPLESAIGNIMDDDDEDED